MPSDEISTTAATDEDGPGGPPDEERPRHAARRRSLLNRLHMPAGKAIALAAMPTAALLGIGFTSPLAKAEPQPDNPFRDRSCVEMPDEPAPAEDDGASAAEETPEPEASASPEEPAEPEADASEEPAGPEPEPEASEQAEAEQAEAEQAEAEQQQRAEPEPAPTEEPEQPSQEPTEDPTEEPTEADPDLIEGIGEGVGDLIGGVADVLIPGDEAPTEPTEPTGPQEPTEEPTEPAGPEQPEGPEESPEPSPEPEPSPSGGGSEPAGEAARREQDQEQQEAEAEETDEEEPEPEPSPSGSPSGDEADAADAADAAAEDPFAPDEQGREPFPCPVEQRVAGTDERTPVTLPNQPWYLEASYLTLRGLDYHGVVNVTTADGSVKQALKFTAELVDIGDLHQIVDAQGEVRHHTAAEPGSNSTIRNGTVTMYTERLQGNLFGLIPVVFDPEHEPPIDLPIAHFTEVSITQAAQFGGELTVPGLHAYHTNDGPTPQP